MNFSSLRMLGLAPLIACAASLGAQAPSLVKNINQQSLSGSSNPSGFVRAGRFTYFLAQGPAGAEVYRTMGFAGTTRLVADIRPGPGSPGVTGMVALGDDVYFTADDGTNGRELWRIDGIAGTAAMVIDFNPSTRELGVSAPVVMGGDVYFIAADHRYRPLLMRSDGTAAGTRAVAIISDTTDQLVAGARMGAFKNHVYFEGRSAQTGRELWRSDGTSAGTGLFADLVPGAGDSLPRPGRSATGKHLYFDALNAGGSRRLFATDGTSTVAVTGPFRFIAEMTPIGDALYFALDDGSAGMEPWRSDGTPAGTAMLRDVFPGADGSRPGDFAALRGLVYFRASDRRTNLDNAELWRTDGTTQGTVQAFDLFPGDRGSNPAGMTPFGNELLFAALADSEGTELYATDGTLAGTRLVLDINRNPLGSSNPAGFTLTGPLNDRLVFRADDGNRGAELWLTNGTAAGTGQLADLVGPTGFHNQDADPDELTDLFGTLLFAADDGVAGVELWRSDGTAAGTVMVRDIHPGSSSYPSGLRVCGRYAWFGARDPVNGHELWRTDGTAAGTVMVADLAPGGAGSGPSQFVGLNGRVVFRAFTPATGHEVFVSDGTAAGTRLLRDIAAGPASAFPFELVRMGDFVYFRASASQAPAADTELWRTDGTPAGTVLVKDIRPGAAGSFPRELTVIDDRLFFVADDGTSGAEPWVSDGTAAGTVVLRDLVPGSAGSEPAGLTRAGQTLFFRATTPQTGSELFRSDGTTQGTTLVVDLIPGADGARPDALVALGDQLFFRAASPAPGSGMWQTDGTVAGTVQLAGTGGNNVYFGGTAAAGERFVCFGVDHPGLGVEPTRTLGRGMQLLGEVNPGLAWSVPESFTVSGNRLYFVADHAIDGKELWSMPMPAHVQRIGAGHRPGGAVPELEASVPVLGTSLTLRLRRGDANRAGVALLGAPSRQPLELGGGLTVYVELVPSPVVVPIRLDGRGAWQSAFPVPNNPALIGLTVAAQVGVDAPGVPPLGLATTPGVRVTLGL